MTILNNRLLLLVTIFLFGITRNSFAQEEPIIVTVETSPEFPGGYDALKAFIDANLVYPARASELGIQGKCHLQFVVHTDGSIDAIKVKRGVTDCPECDQEAIRLLGIMPKWIPGTIAGKPANMTYGLPISFRLQ